MVYSYCDYIYLFTITFGACRAHTCTCTYTDMDAHTLASLHPRERACVCVCVWVNAIDLLFCFSRRCYCYSRSRSSGLLLLPPLRVHSAVHFDRATTPCLIATKKHKMRVNKKRTLLLPLSSSSSVLAFLSSSLAPYFGPCEEDKRQAEAATPPPMRTVIKSRDTELALLWPLST